MATGGESVLGVARPVAAPRKQQDQRGAAALFRSLRRDWVTSAAALFLIVVIFCAVFADQFVQLGLLRDPTTQSLAVRNTPPGRAANGSFYLLGTDQLGRDMLSRLIFGARISLSVGVATVLVSGIIGVLAGLLAGFYRGRVDDILMRLVDIQMGFPSLLIARQACLAAAFPTDGERHVEGKGTGRVARATSSREDGRRLRSAAAVRHIR